jgi:TolB protein
MNKKFVFILALCPLLYTIGSSQDIYLRLTDYAGGKSAIVVEYFTLEKGTPEIAEKLKICEATIRNDLEYSLYFDIYTDTSLLLTPVKKTGVVAKGSCRDNQLSVDLIDFQSHERIAQLLYSLEKEARAVGHKVADEIIRVLTGETGICQTKIVFSYKRDAGKEIGMIDYDGYNFATLTANGNYNLFPCWSPDVQRVLYSTYAGSRLNLYILDLAKRSSQALSSFQGLNFAPCWSPDGNKIALTLTKDGNAEIYLLDLNTKKLQRLTVNPAIDCSPTFSPNSREIAFVSDRSGGPQVYIMDSDGGNVRRLTYHGDYNTSAAWSPRGDLIVYVSRESDNSQQIYVTDPYDYQPVQVTFEENNEEPCWAADGLHIVFSSNRTGMYELYTMNWDGTRQRKLTQGLAANAPDWSGFVGK